MKKLISVIALLAVVCIFSLFAVASSSDNASVSGDSVDVSEKNTTAPTNLRLSVGETLDTDNLKMTFVSANVYKDSNQFIQPKSGNVFYRAEFNVENRGTSDLYISDYDFKCYADGVACDPTYITSANDTLSASLSTGRKATGAVYFEVPSNAQSIEIEYEHDFWNSTKAIFVIK